MILQVILTIIVLGLAIPAGNYITRNARDELVYGRKWFLILMGLAIIGILNCLFFGEYPIALTLAFIFIVCLISYKKSFDKEFVKRRI